MAETLDAEAAAAGETPPPTVALLSSKEIGGLGRTLTTERCLLEEEERAPDAAEVEGGDQGRLPHRCLGKEMEAMRPEVTALECDGLRADIAWKQEQRGKENDATIDLACSEVYCLTLPSFPSKSQPFSHSQSRSMVEETLDLETAAIAVVGETSAEVVSSIFSTGSVELAQNFELGGPFIDTEGRVFDAAAEMKDDIGKLSISRYSRKEMESMRSWGVVEQRRWWKEVYEGLGELIAQEYDGLCVASSSKKQKRGRKKKVAKVLPVVSEEVGVDAESSNPLSCLGIACDDANVGSQSNQVEEWCCEVEDTNNEDDGSDDEPDSIQRRAFLIVGEPDFDSGPPQDGMEYLRRVRWEAAQIPNVKVAKLKSTKQDSDQTPYMPKIPQIEKCPSHLLPSKHWEDSFIAEFSELRQAFSQLEDSCDQPSTIRQNEKYCKDPKSPPTMSLLRSMDAVSRASTLQKYISMFESANELTGDDCQWLFALTVVVDTPLDADLCASMRCLLRKCSSLLARKSDPDDEVAMLNILIAISGSYFRQSGK